MYPLFSVVACLMVVSSFVVARLRAMLEHYYGYRYSRSFRLQS
jgi:hypothetical protein